MVAVMCGYSRRNCIAGDVVLCRVKKKATRVGDAGGADVMQHGCAVETARRVALKPPKQNKDGHETMDGEAPHQCEDAIQRAAMKGRGCDDGRTTTNW
jgi:hypothetical protein